MANCFLRAVERSDIEQWMAWINRADVMEGLDRALPVTLEEHERFIERNVAGRDDAIWFSIEAEDHTYVGNIWMWEIHWRHRRAEVRLFVAHERYQRRGIASGALRLLCDYAFGTLGLNKLYAYVHERNEASAKAFQKAGFSLEATLEREAFRSGSFHSVLRFARIAPS
jgi:[ribosomal protein S5]-alanine N-acetyltransferase